jgi:hypothetical protein
MNLIPHSVCKKPELLGRREEQLVEKWQGKII